MPEGQRFQPRKTIQISTVLTGMVRNDCGELLKSVSIHIKVQDEEGKRGDGWVTVSPLNSGEAKQFSNAWMGPSAPKKSPKSSSLTTCKVYRDSVLHAWRKCITLELCDL